ncbi:MAG: flippase [Deltaproteobacteria bacterium]|nr:flippase [Deltaproteobacteria bacterium]MBZ0219094.1 flippase [Deltaproteobacteria bacterium]
MISWIRSFFSKRRVASNFLWSLLGEGTSKSVIFITNVHLARVLGVSNFGVFSVAQIITLYLWVLADVGIGLYGIREIARRRDGAEAIANPLITLRIVSGLAFFLIYSAVIFMIEMPFDARLVYMCSGLYLLTNSFYPDWVLKGLEKFKFIALGSFVTSGVFLVSIFLFVNSTDDTARAALLSSLSFLFGSMILILSLKRITGISFRPSFNFRMWYHHVRESIFFTISGFFYLLYIFLPVLILQFLLSSFEVGLFSAPYRIVLAACTAGYLIPTAFYPVLSEHFISDKNAFFTTQRRLRSLMLAIGAPIGAAGTIWGSALVMFLFGSQYEESVGIFTVLIWLVPLIFLRYSYCNVFSAAGLQRLHNLITMLGVLFISALGPAFVISRGVVGAAEAMIISEALTITVMAYAFHKRLKKLIMPGYAAC